MELMHYSSKYYDPIKAHEYYEQHKNLKGRSSTSGMTSDQKKVAQYVKDSLNKERINKTNTSKEKTKQDIKNYTRKMQTEIASLKIVLESGSLKNDPEKRYEFISKIKALREANNKKKEELLNAHNKYASSLKDEYDKKYDDELNKIISSSSKKASSLSINSEPSNSNNSDNSNKSDNISTDGNKEQTSSWARRRIERKRKETYKNLIKRIHGEKASHKDDTLNGYYGILDDNRSMSHVAIKNIYFEKKYGDLKELAHSLLNKY